jgi:hypothetical protein
MFVLGVNKDRVFIRSNYIRAFPCGRRRSTLISEGDGAANKYYIPFDPQARLNTEENNRKHSSLNGFTQNFVCNERNGVLPIVIDGYLFEILLSESYSTPALFAAAIERKLGVTTDVLYANIWTVDITLMEATGGVAEVSTEILRDQSTSAVPASCIDIFQKEDDGATTNSDIANPENYYFAGLLASLAIFNASFSSSAKTIIELPPTISLM